MLILSSRHELQQGLGKLRRGCSHIVLVPTMGGLHQGHEALVRRAQEITGAAVVVSLWLNPLQFDDPEDLRSYPHDRTCDLEVLRRLQVDAVFTPQSSWFGKNAKSFVENPIWGRELCGASRPGHFRGVCTVVMQLFGIIAPQSAVFGRKDFQQLRIIEQMVKDFYLPVKIISVETVRDEQGLALSSRNAHLQGDALLWARHIYASLQNTRHRQQQGVRQAAELEQICREELSFYPQLCVDYIEVRAQHDLSKVTDTQRSPSVLLVAVRVPSGSGAVRLIDHIMLEPFDEAICS